MKLQIEYELADSVVRQAAELAAERFFIRDANGAGGWHRAFVDATERALEEVDVDAACRSAVRVVVERLASKEAEEATAKMVKAIVRATVEDYREMLTAATTKDGVSAGAK